MTSNTFVIIVKVQPELRSSEAVESNIAVYVISRRRRSVSRILSELSIRRHNFRYIKPDEGEKHSTLMVRIVID